MSTVVEVENISKKYALGVLSTGVLVRDIDRWWHRVRGKPGPFAKITAETEPPDSLRMDNERLVSNEMWALRGISFEVKRGEILGIIGRNGAGKSTLLKILSRVTAPTGGEVRVKGRIASLLEVGTGFHPELTGRENIFLNGAILGMNKAEIKGKFDEIVAFAEIEKFLDTPVKRYSSGMYVRLAFAVAAHLDPEILIVDEVLAVGDAEFQKKCLGKMNTVAASGRTILFVSHSMGAVQSLCGRALVLESGDIAFNGGVQNAVSHYFLTLDPKRTGGELSGCTRVGTGEAHVLSIRFEDENGIQHTHFRMGEPMNIVVRVRFSSVVASATLGINIVTDTGVLVADCRSSHYGLILKNIAGVIEYRMSIESVTLYPRTYFMEPWVADSSCNSTMDWVKSAATVVVTSGPHFMGGANVTANHGISHVATTWRIECVT